MEDENGIELSLGLSCGGSSGYLNDKDICSDLKAEDGGNNKLKGKNSNVTETSLKPFFHIGIEDQIISGSQRSDPVVQQQENFFTDLGRFSGQEPSGSTDVHGSRPQFTWCKELWGTNNNLVKIEEEKGKRKFLFEEVKDQKKQERKVEHAEERHGNSCRSNTLLKGSHISGTIEEGFFAENEEVAESDAQGSTLRLASQHDGSVKRYMAGGFDVPRFKDKQGFTNSNAIDIQRQKWFSVVGNESGIEIGNTVYGIPFPLPPTTSMTVPYSQPIKVPTTAPTTSIISGIPSSSFMQLMPSGSSDHTIIQSMNPGNFPAAFGYSSVQHPTLESFHQHHLSTYAGRSLSNGVPNLFGTGSKMPQAAVQVPHGSRGALQNDGKASELAMGRQHATEEVTTCSSSHTEDEGKGKNTTFSAKEVSDQPAVEGFTRQGSAIRPGVAPGVKFGGCGLYPDLPWVSTTGSGPDGKTISGVTYRYGNNQIRIVCACHGSHMSPEEFVQHASDATNPGNNMGLVSCPSSNPATSAQS